jgi:predicted RNA-binding Zn ribbon-like protein
MPMTLVARLSGVNVVFTYDTEVALVSAVALVNTAARGAEGLPDQAALDRFLLDQRWTGSRTHDQRELDTTRSLRPVLRRFWEVGTDEAVGIVNRLLVEGAALPQLVRHDDWGWHLHATHPAAPLATRMSVEAAMAMVDVVRADELSRLRICAAEDCDAVLVDLSRNRSKRYCDIANCGNRANVAAYRARRAGGGRASA